MSPKPEYSHLNGKTEIHHALRESEISRIRMEEAFGLLEERLNSWKRASQKPRILMQENPWFTATGALLVGALIGGWIGKKVNSRYPKAVKQRRPRRHFRAKNLPLRQYRSYDEEPVLHYTELSLEQRLARQKRPAYDRSWDEEDGFLPGGE